MMIGLTAAFVTFRLTTDTSLEWKAAHDGTLSFCCVKTPDLAKLYTSSVNSVMWRSACSGSISSTAGWRWLQIWLWSFNILLSHTIYKDHHSINVQYWIYLLPFDTDFQRYALNICSDISKITKCNHRMYNIGSDIFDESSTFKKKRLIYMIIQLLIIFAWF